MEIFVFFAFIAIAFRTEAVSSNGSENTDLVRYELGICRSGYTPNLKNSKCYKLSTATQTWGNTIITCKNEGAKLATPTSTDEAWYLSNELRKHKLLESDKDLKYAFIGVVRKSENNWRDTYTDHPLNIEIPWAEGEPNKAVGQISCSVIDYHGRLHAYYCNTPAVFFCEYEQQGPLIHYLEELVSESLRP